MEPPIYFVNRRSDLWEHLAQLEYPPLPNEIDPPLPVHKGSIFWTVQTY